VIEFFAKYEVSESGWEVIHWVVEARREGEVGERGRKSGEWVLESGSQVARKVAKSEVGEGGR
jgi:hypothetical protein